MQSGKTLFIATLCWISIGVVCAKLPPLTDDQKAKAEEGKAKAADVAKKSAEALTKVQDRVAAGYIKAQKTKGVIVKPTPVAAASPPAAPAKK